MLRDALPLLLNSGLTFKTSDISIGCVASFSSGLTTSGSSITGTDTTFSFLALGFLTLTIVSGRSCLHLEILHFIQYLEVILDFLYYLL